MKEKRRNLFNFQKKFDIFNIYLILTLLNSIFILIKPTLNFKSKFVVVLFKKSNINNAICYSLINEFKRVQNIFSYISDDEIEFIEIDCEAKPTKCSRFQVFGVPQIHVYILKNEFTKDITSSQINSTENENKRLSNINNDKFNEISNKKRNLYIYFMKFLDIIFPISIRSYYINIFQREKINLLNNTAESISFSITNFSSGRYQPNLRKYTMTPHRKPSEINKLIFHQYKCSISLFYQHLIPTNVREFYDDVLLNETFNDNFSLRGQVETSFIDALIYKKEIKQRYNISHFPMMAFEYMGSRNVVNTSISIELMKKVLKRTCESSPKQSNSPKKRKARQKIVND